MRFSTRIAKIIFIVTTILLLVISTILYVQVNDLVEANNMVNHTTEIKLRLEQVLSNSKDAETAQRGFLMTGDSLFLQPYASAYEGANRSIDYLKNLTKNSDEQLENVNKLQSLVQTRFNSFYPNIHEYLNEETMAGKRQILLKEKSLMDSIRRQTNKMESIETRLMGKRESIKNKHAFLAPLATVLLIFFTLAILVSAYYRIILDLKRSENYVAQMRGLNKELLEKNRELQITNEELDSFNYISSHDLQEPVRKIRTFISIIEDADFEKLSEKSRHNFQRMRVSAIRIQELLHDLLVYSQINKTGHAFENVDLNTIIEKAKKKFEELIIKTGATINYSALPTLNANAFQMQQLFENLISNSIKYRNENIRPVINIESQLILENELSGEGPTEKAYHKIIFKDNGIGFDQVHANKVFELFSRLHTNEQKTGTGIGLTICKKVLQNHNGFIRVESKLNEGTSFFIYLAA